MSRQLTLSGLNLSDYRLTVGLNIQGIDFGASLGDYYVYLRHSGNGITEQTRVLLNRVGLATDPLGVGSLADGINAIFADSAGANVQAAADPSSGPLLGTFQPASLLSESSNGLNSMGSTDWNGTWTLFVSDEGQNGTGNLVDWFLQFEDMSGAGASPTPDGLEYEVVDNPGVNDDGTNKATISGNELEAKSGTGRITIRARYPGGSAWTTNTISLNKKAQTITFPDLGKLGRNSAPLDPGATSDSGLSVTYRSSSNAVATISTDGKIEPRGTGTVQITASQPGDENYAVATEVVRTLEVIDTPLDAWLGLLELYNQDGDAEPTAGQESGNARSLYDKLLYAELSSFAGASGVEVRTNGATFATNFLSQINQIPPDRTGFSKSSYQSPGMASGYTTLSNALADLPEATYVFEAKNNASWPATIVASNTVVWSHTTNFPIQKPRLTGTWASGYLRVANPTASNNLAWVLWTNRPAGAEISVKIEQPAPGGYAPPTKVFEKYLAADTSTVALPAATLATNKT